MDFIDVPTLSFEQAHKPEVLALIGQKVRSIAQCDSTWQLTIKKIYLMKLSSIIKA